MRVKRKENTDEETLEEMIDLIAGQQTNNITTAHNYDIITCILLATLSSTDGCLLKIPPRLPRLM